MFTRSFAFVAILLLCAGGAHIRADAGRAPEDAAITHVLNRLSYGPRPGDVERVRTLGLQRWIETQLSPSRIDNGPLDGRLQRLQTLALDSQTIQREYSAPARAERRQKQLDNADADRQAPAMRAPAGEAQRKNRQVIADLEEAKLLRAVYSERQLEEVLVDFWFNHFNVFAGKGATRDYIGEYEREAIRPHVLGNFRDLLGATAKSPAMLFYLDNWLSTAEGARGAQGAGLAQSQRRSSGLNENYARELLELHTLGVDGGYTQHDIVNIARAFTGWTLQPRRGSGFRFVAARHDRGEKVVLGQTIKAGGGVDDGNRVLDIVAAHPATARHIATRLAIKFVSDTPSPQLIDRIASRFTATGGDLREVLRALLSSPEFLSPDAYRAKVKTPLEFVASAMRATGADLGSALPLSRTLRDMGMPLYFCQPPTGYDDAASSWVSAGALVSRMNFAVELSKNAMRGVRVPLTEQQTTALGIGAPRFQRQ
ncbi:MAG: DUF1800 domain-containing protein [Vicinamibacterales bacterium]